jgi:hypothetical protein
MGACEMWLLILSAQHQGCTDDLNWSDAGSELTQPAEENIQNLEMY